MSQDVFQLPPRSIPSIRFDLDTVDGGVIDLWPLYFQ